MHIPDRLPGLPEDSPARFYQGSAETLPGSPLPPRLGRPVLPQACIRYGILWYYLLFAVRDDQSDDATVVVNMPELQAGVGRSRHWIRRGFHTLAACGLVYSVPTNGEDGVDRRRYRFRLCVRTKVAVPESDSRTALRALAEADDEESDVFPAHASWTRTGAPPEDSAADSERSGAGPVESRQESSPAGPDPERSGAGPVERRQESASAAPDPERSGAGPVEPRPVASAPAAAAPADPPDPPLSPDAVRAAAALEGPLSLDAKRALVTSDPRFPRDLEGLHPDYLSARGRLVDDAVAAVRARLGQLQTVGVGKIDGEILERAVDYREREAARCAIVNRLGPEADVATDYVDYTNRDADHPDLVLPSDPDFKPGRSGWTYSAGCWHAPDPVCGCFEKGVLRERLAQLAVARYKASVEASKAAG